MKSFVYAIALLCLLLAPVGCDRSGWSLDPHVTFQNSPDLYLNQIAGQKGSEPNSDQAFHFVVMADRNGNQELGKWQQAVQEVNLLRPDFVMCVGDLARGYKEDPNALADDWDAFHAENNGLKAPFFYTPGNHDVLGVEVRKAYSARHNVNGAPYYSFNFRGCHFVVMDTTCIVETKTDPQLVQAQWEWLAKDLSSPAAASAGHVFVFMHFPLWDTRATSGGRKNSGDEWKRLRAMLDPARTTCFAGHTHKLLYSLADGVPCHTLAVTAAKTSGNLARGDFQMFAYVTVDGGEPTVAYIPVGQVQPHDFIERAVLDAADGALDDVCVTAVPATGGQSAIRLVNSSAVEVAYRLQWQGSVQQLEALAGAGAAAANVMLPPGGGKTINVTAGPMPVGAGPRLKIDGAFVVKGRPHAVTEEIELPVVKRFAVQRGRKTDLQKGLVGADKVAGEQTPARFAWTMTYDDQNLHLFMDVDDSRIVTEGKDPWERDGVEIFWDPRGDDQGGGKFKDSCRQLLIPIPADGQGLVVETNPQDPALASAVKAAWTKREGGYRIAVDIPLSSIARGFVPAPGQALRMDLQVDNKDDPKGKAQALSLSGKPLSSRQTGHYVMLVLQ